MDKSTNASKSCRGILAIWHDVDPSRAVEFEQWHRCEHMRERLAVDGFLLGRRYEAVESSPLVFNYYVTESPSTLTAPAYLQRLNQPTRWTVEIMPALRGVYRAAGREVASVGTQEGDVVATLRFSTRVDQRQCFLDWFREQGQYALLDVVGISRVHWWETDVAASVVETTESNARGGNAEVRDWTIVLEGNGISAVRAGATRLQQIHAFSGTLQQVPLVGAYRLVHHSET